MSTACDTCGKPLVNRGGLCDLCVCGGETIRTFWTCSGCGAGYYSEYYDCWDTDDPADVWFALQAAVFEDGLERIAACPEPSSKFCECPLHPFSMDVSRSRRL